MAIGYLLIVQIAPELDTLNIVDKLLLHLAKSLEQQDVVLTVVEVLYPKLLELKKEEWRFSRYHQNSIRTEYNMRMAITSQAIAMLRWTTDDGDDEYTHTLSVRKLGWRKTTLVKAA
ncbi:hypothetical protein LSH36_817g00149 [Paralvinella palmiformis]|uniref:Uncharacterized protein n=1 Tax=Paralvinella palmiformis TaxID=53620 RepID=A0AAD9MTY2_9ANNE|nr:hypothetical protein LSH36_817g00149 [Paralvinella palmiformis]